MLCGNLMTVQEKEYWKSTAANKVTRKYKFSRKATSRYYGGVLRTQSNI